MLPPASTAKKTRSHSQTPRSGFQTPTTPANRTPLSNSYLQSADKRGPVEDKLFIHQESAKITNFAIRQNVQGFGRDTKLKNVTYKQFTGLVEFMLEILVGSRCALQGIDDIMKGLHLLNYPYTINKSWLKTPTAGHAFNHVVLMLGWLLNLVEPPLMPGGETELDDFESIHNLEHDVEFPTIMYQKVFMEKAKEGFKMWDLRDDENFEKLNEELANMHVTQSTNGAVDSIKRLDDDMIALEKEQKQLRSKVKPSTNHQKYMELEKEVKEMKRVLEGKREIVSQICESIAAESKLYEDEKKILQQRDTQISKIRSQIRGQVMSKEKMKQLIIENFTLRKTLEAEQECMQKLLDENVKDPVEVSLLLRQKVQKVNELNETMFKLTKNFQELSNYNLTDLALNPNSSDIRGELANLKPIFQAVKKWLSDASDMYRASQINVQAQIEEISCEFEENQKKLKKGAEKVALELQTLNRTLGELEKKLTEVNEKYEEEKKEQETVKKEVAQIRAEIETEKVANAKVTEETQIIMKRFVEEQAKMLEDLRAEERSVDEKLEYYKKVRDDMKKVVLQKQSAVSETLKNLKN